MLYQQYKSKIEKISAVLKKIFKYRVPIIIVLSAITLSVTVLLSLRGIVVTGEIVNPVVMYGEEFEYDASAVLSGKISYEYRPVNGEWRDKKPTKAGEYEVRAVSRRTFGIKSYGDALKFKIEKRPIEVTPNGKTIPYGDNPEIDGDCVFGDSLYCGEFDIADKYAWETAVTPKLSAVRIVNGNGDDVTDSYEITVKSATITYTNRPLTVFAGSADKVYDGTPLTCEDYSVDGGLFDGQIISVIRFDGSILNAGEIKNRILTDSVIITAVDGTDVTDFYALTAVDGTLTVNKRNVTVTSGDGEMEYDGKALIVESASLTEGSLANGETISYDNFLKNAIDCGAYENLFGCKIKNASGDDVTGNYNIATVNGTLTVNKRKIAIKTGSAEFVYDGTPQSVKVEGAAGKAWTYADGSKTLVDEHNLGYVPTSVTAVSDSGKQNEFYTVKVYNNQGDFTENYDITFDYGTLTVTKRGISIKTGSKNFVYNGTERSYGEWEYNASEYKLVVGHELRFESSTITNVGKAANEFSNVTVFYGEDVTENYNITVLNSGVLTVEKRQVTVTPKGAEKVYDGEELYCHDYTAVCTNDSDDDIGFVLNHGLKVLESTKIINANIVPNKYTSWQVADNGVYDETIADNYDIKVVKGGNLIINKREITVTANSAEFEYDGEEHSYNECTVPDGSLVNGHLFTVTESTAKTDVKRGGARKTAGYDSILSYDNEITAYTITCDGKDYFNDGVIEAKYVDNYSVTCISGTLTITPRKITIKTGSADKVYDGTPLTCDDRKIARREGFDGEALVKNHKFEVSELTSVINVLRGGDNGVIGVENKFEEYSVLDGGGNDKTHNYEIEFENGTLTVIPREITIETATTSWTYDGNYHSDIDFKITVGSLAENQRAECATEDENLPKIKYFKYNPVENKFAVKILSNGSKYYKGGDNVTDNYDITYTYGTLTVTKRELTINANDVTIVYDGVRHLYLQEYKNYSIVNIVSGDEIDLEIKLTDETGGLNVGDYNAEIKVNKITDGNEDVTDCYEIMLYGGILTITKRSVTIKTATTNWTYDGNYHFDNDFEVVGDVELAENQRAECATKDENLPKIKYVKDNPVENKFAVKILSNGSEYYGEGENVTDNYDITYTYGELTLIPLKITVTANSDEFEYDGDEHYCNGYTITDGSLVYGDVMTAIVSGGGTDVGEYENTVTVIEIKDKVGVVVTDCYDITYGVGKITITPRKITIKTGSADKVYDGNPLTCTGFEIMRREGFDGDALVKNHKFEVTQSTSITDVGSIANEFTEYVIKDNNNKDKTHNYEIEFENRILTVNKRVVKIDTLGANFVYNGTERSYGEWEYNSASEYALVNGHTLSFESSTITNVGEKENDFSELKVYNGEEDVTLNYEIEVVNKGTLTVTPRKVTVTPNGAEKVYDGEELYCHDYTAECTNDDNGNKTGFVLNHGLQILESAKIVNAGSVKNRFIIYHMVVEGVYNETIAANYIVTCVAGGNLTITPRKITIETGSAEREYDGTPLTCTEYKSYLSADNKKTGFIGGDKIVVFKSASITEPGSVENVFDAYEIVDKNGNKTNTDGFGIVANNYEIEFKNGILTVNKRKITVTFGDISFVYDGETHTAVEWMDDAITYNFLSGFDLSFSNFNEFKNVVDHGEITADYEITNLNNGENKTDCFDVVFNGTITVTPRPVAIETATKSFEYDGDSHFDGSKHEDVSEVDNSGLLEGHTAVFSDWATITDYVENGINNKCTVTVTDGDGEPVSDNYSFTFTGTLTIEKRDIHIVTDSEEFTFDGQDHYGSEYVSVDNLVGGHMFTFKSSPVKYVNDSGKPNNVAEWNVFDCDNVDVARNYKVEVVGEGILTVNPADVTLKVADEEKDYDGTPLTPSRLEFVSGGQFSESGYKIIPYNDYFEGSQTDVGSSNSGYNIGEYGSYSIEFKDGDIDITNCFNVTFVDNGTLTVNLSIGGDDGLDRTIGTLKAEKSQTVYLKLWSYKEYSERFKAFGNAYPNTLYGYSYDYLTAKSLESLGIDKNSATVNFEDGYYAYPFYWFDGDNLPESDVMYALNGGVMPYTANFYDFKYLRYNKSVSGNADSDYFAYVSREYKGLVAGKNNDDMASYLNNVITENGLEKATPQGTVLAVIAYVRSLADYNLKYNTALDANDNSVRLFLEGAYKQNGAVCRHYAAAATYLLRALGYPARVTEGYLVNAKAGEEVDIKVGSGHAWTEVYIEGVGWVIIDATPAGGRGGGDEGDGDGSGGDGGDSGEDPAPSEPEEKDFFEMLKSLDVIVKPKDAKKLFDDTPLTASDYEFVKRIIDENGNVSYEVDDGVAGLFNQFSIDGFAIFIGELIGSRDVQEEASSGFAEFYLRYNGANSITSKDGSKVLNSGDILTEDMFKSFELIEGKLTVLPPSVKGNTFAIRVVGSVKGSYNGQKLSLEKASGGNIGKIFKAIATPISVDKSRVKFFRTESELFNCADTDFDYAFIIPLSEIYIENVDEKVDFAKLNGKYKIYCRGESDFKDVTESFAVIFTELKYSGRENDEIIKDLSEKAPTALGEAGGYFEKERLTLTKADVKVVFLTQSVKYDEKPHTPTYKVENLIDGYKLTMVSGAVPSFIIEGSYDYEIEPKLVVITDASGNTVTRQNFNIEFVTSPFTVLP